MSSPGPDHKRSISRLSRDLLAFVAVHLPSEVDLYLIQRAASNTSVLNVSAAFIPHYKAEL